jgi:hypothetical protein
MRYSRAAVAAAALVIVSTAPASAASTRTTEDVTGETFPCATNTYTLKGFITVVQEHEHVDAQGQFHTTGTVTTTGLTATDASGTTYAVRGSQWFGFNETPNGGVGTFTFHLNFIARGAGVVDTVRVVDHFGPNGEILHDSSTCIG